jgi:hypothetical protein
LVIIPCGDIPWINRLKHGFQDDVTDVLWHIYFDCGGSVQWNKDKTGYEPFQER